MNSCKWKWVSLEAEHQQHGKFSLGNKKKFFITIALVFVILKHSLQRRGAFLLYLGPVPVPEYLLVNSAARRFLMAADVEGKFFIWWRVHWPYLVVQVYELITCVRRANENARNLISVVQFSIKTAIQVYWGHYNSPCRTYHLNGPCRCPNIIDWKLFWEESGSSLLPRIFQNNMEPTEKATFN